MSRIENSKKNIKYGYLGNIINIIIKFISRTIFINTIGATFLGVNGLYSNILSILSFTELGIGTAINFSLYKPVAENEREKIKSLMALYRKSYKLIALLITVIGLAIVPFLGNLINDAGSLTNNQLIVYYLIFLYNTISTYFISYKYSLSNADQKNYIQTNISTITMVITTILQIISLLIFQNYLVFLIIASIVQTGQIIYANKYLNKRYPVLLEKNQKNLSEEDLAPIKKNIKALMYHKVGEISIYSTDNIVISAFISVRTVGLISNYNLLITSVQGIINMLFNSVISSLGNLIATERIEKQRVTFEVYSFIGFWIFGFSSLALVILMGPFIEIWIGNNMLISEVTVLFLCIDFYLRGRRIVVNNFKTAAGVFDADKYIGLIQGIVNLVLSIILVNIIGVPGVYLATIVQGLIANVIKPFIIYKEILHMKPMFFYKKAFKYGFAVFVSYIILRYVKFLVLSTVTIFNFAIMMIIVLVVPNILFFVLFYNTTEFKYLKNYIKIK